MQTGHSEDRDHAWIFLILLCTMKFWSTIMSPTTMFIIFSDILIDEQIFFSPEVKTSVIISNKHGIYELPHELRNDLRLRKLGNIRKISKFHIIIA